MTKALRNPVVMVYDPTGDFSVGNAFGLQEFFCGEVPCPWEDGTVIERSKERFCLCDGDLVWLPEDPITSRITPEEESKAVFYAERATGEAGLRAVRSVGDTSSRWILSHRWKKREPFSIRDTERYILPKYRQILREMHRKWMREFLSAGKGKL